MAPGDIEHRFAYHPPQTPEASDAHQWVRSELRILAEALDHRLPNGREKAVVMTKLEEVMFWANAAIARAGE